MIILQHVHSDARAQKSPVTTVPGWPLTQVWPLILCVGGPEAHSSLNLNKDPIKVQSGSVSAGHGCFEWSPSLALMRGKPWMWPWVLLSNTRSRTYQSLTWGKHFCKYECMCLRTWKWLQLFKILCGISCNTLECDATFLRMESESEWRDIRPSIVTHTLNLCSAFNPSKVHTHSSEHTHTVNTHPEQWAAIYAVTPREQLGVRCLAQGHLSRGIEGRKDRQNISHTCLCTLNTKIEWACTSWQQIKG